MNPLPDKNFAVLRVFALAVYCTVLSSGCGVMVKLGLKSPPDIDRRQGPTGTHQFPAVLNPFQEVQLVMAADECRTFRVRIPQGWYLKYLVTVANRQEGRQAYLKAAFDFEGPAWAELSPYPLKKQFYLKEGSSQAVIALANPGPSRDVLLEMCQEGPPLRITLKPETSKVVESLVMPYSTATPDPDEE